ncbi:MAG TPA: beta-ketoacyl-ACP synthase II [Thermomicrobiaceae bacterium]|nr:beta-ketoacyl-ACP synthase II [Thermomicrobiaceae bacterium]
MANPAARPAARRIVVTGMGIISPIGNTLESVWDALVSGRSGTGPISRFDAAGFASRVAAEVRDFDPRERLGAKEARRTDRFVQLAVAAAQDALTDAGLAIDERNAGRVGVLLGSALGGIETAEREIGTLLTRGPGRVSPFFIPMFLADMGAGYVSIVLGARGPNFATLSACASAAHAIGEAAETIRRGDADVMLAGGSEAAVTPASVAGFAALGALSTRNDEPETASRPFDATRDGFVVAEGAAVLVLESLEHAAGRDARILAEIAGYGATADAGHITQPLPDGQGAAEAMSLAIRRGGITPDEVDYVNAHGTSTPLNDRFETQAIKRTFGTRIPLVSSTKALTGHLLGAAGAVEAVATVLAIQHGAVPPTWHRRVPDPDCDLDYVTDGPRRQPIAHALSNSFGFGGHNASLLLSHYAG